MAKKREVKTRGNVINLAQAAQATPVSCLGCSGCSGELTEPSRAESNWRLRKSGNLTNRMQGTREKELIHNTDIYIDDTEDIVQDKLSLYLEEKQQSRMVSKLKLK